MINKKKKKTKFLIISIVFIAVVAIVLNISSKSNKKESEYDAETANKGDIITYYSFSGNTESKDEKQLITDKMLKIKEFRVKEGDNVNAGDVLYVIDKSDSDANLKQAAAAVEIAQINYNNTKNGLADQQLISLESAVSKTKLSYDDAVKNLNRITTLYNEGGIAEQNLQQAQTQHDLAKEQYESALKNYNLTKDKQINVSIDAAKAQLEQAKAAYEVVENQAGEAEIVADMSGEITKIYADENISLMVGSPIMDIANFSEMKAVVKVDEYDISSVTKDKDVIVRVDALDKDFKGKISKIAKNVTKDKTGISLNEISYYSAEIDIENSSELYSGMSVEVKVLNQSVTGVVTISMKSLQFDDENKPYVLYFDQQGKIATKQVKLGINDGNTVQIIEGLNEGDVIQVPKKSLMLITPFDMMTGGE